MKKGHFLAIILMSCFVVLSGCIKNQPYVTTLDPSLTAKIGTYTFTAETVVPSTLDSQMHDTITGLIISGNTADPTSHRDQIVLFVTKYKESTGTFSIVQKQAGAYYYHSGIKSPAIAGVVAITRIGSNNLVGYFNFTTSDGIVIKDGNFSVGKP